MSENNRKKPEPKDRPIDRIVRGLSGMLGGAARNVGSDRERKIDEEIRRRSK